MHYFHNKLKFTQQISICQHSATMMGMVSSGLKHKIKHLYEQNRRQSGEYTYTIPSSDTYPYQWFWDSCFAAITLTYFDVPAAKRELRSLVSKQFGNGMIPHML